MCIVSTIGDQWSTSAPKQWPNAFTSITTNISRFEFDALVAKNVALRAEVEQLRIDLQNLRKLLKLAKVIDETTGQPDCENDDKVALIKRVADLLDVDLEGVFG